MTGLDRDEPARSAIPAIALILIASLVVVFALAVIAGMLSAAGENEGPHSVAFYLVMTVAALVAAGGVWVIVRNRWVARLPGSPRMRKSRVLLYASMALGLVTGVVLTLVEGVAAGDFFTLMSPDAAMSPGAALVLVGTFAVAVVLSVRWHILLDEHERASYDFGAVAAIYVYFTASIGWWLLARGGLAPPPDGYAIFWLVTITWLIGWVIRRRA